MRRRVTRQLVYGALAGATLASAVCFVIGATIYERQAKDMRWLSRRLVEKRGVLERQAGQLAEMVAAVDQLAGTLGEVGERLQGARSQSGVGGHSGDDEPLLEPVVADEAFEVHVRSDVERAIEQLVWMERQADAIGESAEMLASLLDARRRPAVHRGGVPSIWPVSGRVTSEFGVRRSPGRGGSRQHPGMDIAAPHGARVEATAAGVVTFAGGSSGYGRMVVVDHGGELQTVYAHLATVFAREGQQVRRGDLLGTVGMTGRTTGPHLHYEVRFRGEPVDPMCYIDGRAALGRRTHAGLRG
ncbi:MAG TPA: M23 family metallopeptidase [Candidatus Limnocylindria bacterium]|nr:M23 family metallopeptidase [Candidatus Limnocylindria bacterium]